MHLLKKFKMLTLFFLLLSCEDDRFSEPILPANLTVKVDHDSTGGGLVIIEARADNTTEYQLRIGQSAEASQINTTGVFSHRFDRSGLWNLDVRAYGASGRYLREDIPLTVSVLNTNVSVENGYISPLSYEGYSLVWNDEFGGTDINPGNWVFETGTGCPNLCGWGNNELQSYRRENAWIEDGVLVIEARKENHLGRLYTSARMKTQGRQSFKYGRFDIRALMPKGQGIWPAIWMLGDNITSVGWPKSGEIDIMELIGGKGREKTTHGTLHWDYNGHRYTGGSHTLASDTFADEYHVFSIIWDETQIRWFVNETQFHTINITPEHMSEFHEKFHFLLNIAVGGNWPGSPDDETLFPQQMKVDYIRVFQKNQ
jgi:beta-glucanase (GH16 family)